MPTTGPSRKQRLQMLEGADRALRSAPAEADVVVAAAKLAIALQAVNQHITHAADRGSFP